MLNSTTEAYQLLSQLGATERLLTHVKLVGEAADMLINKFEDMDLAFDANLIRLGAAIHDAGKILHPNELDGPGSLHEPAGEKNAAGTRRAGYRRPLLCNSRTMAGDWFEPGRISCRHR